MVPAGLGAEDFYGANSFGITAIEAAGLRRHTHKAYEAVVQWAYSIGVRPLSSSEIGEASARMALAQGPQNALYGDLKQRVQATISDAGDRIERARAEEDAFNEAARAAAVRRMQERKRPVGDENWGVKRQFNAVLDVAQGRAPLYAQSLMIVVALQFPTSRCVARCAGDRRTAIGDAEDARGRRAAAQGGAEGSR